MKRSSRLAADLTTNATARALASLRAHGEAIIDLTESNPTRVGLEYPTELLAPLSDPRALRYEPDPLGLLIARQAVSADFARRSLTVSPDRIALTASTSEAYALLFKLLCDPGDEALVPRPSYPLFEHLTRLEAVTPVSYALEYHGRWRISLDDLRDALEAHPRVRALLIVSPNNPTGSFLHADDLAAVVELCASRELALIGDEVFADYPLDTAPDMVSVLSQQLLPTCALGGLSKSAGLPQVKLGWIAFQGPPTVIENMLRAYEVIADTYLSVATPTQMAAPELLQHGATIRLQIQRRITRNLAALRRAAAAIDDITVLPAEGGWSAVLQVPSIRTEESLVLDLLNDDRVLVYPGYFFDFPREAFVVISLLVEPDAFDRGVARVLARATTAGARS